MKRFIQLTLCIICASITNIKILVPVFVITLAFTAYVHISEYGWKK